MATKLSQALAAILAAATLLAPVAAPLAAPNAASAAARDAAVPRYRHVFVIIEENKSYGEVMDPGRAPRIAALAAKYGDAARFYAEMHPSEPNYVALLGGDTFGLRDDDGYYCRPGMTSDPACARSGEPGYVDHTVRARQLGDQLAARGLTWKGYYQSLPAPGSLAVIASDPAFADGTRKTALYAAKHSAFMNFYDVQHDPRRAARIVGFRQLYADIAADRLPNFAVIVPNQCNEMHGLHGSGVPFDCDGAHKAALIRRGDAFTGRLVERLQQSAAWRSRDNMAIVITFDEGAGRSRQGCCGVTPGAPSNFGGGHIPTIVITNHGPRGLKDPTPYSHYSLLRTIEDAFGIETHLGHAGDAGDGVTAMAPLFAVRR